MAKIEFDGVEDLISTLRKMGEGIDQTAPQAARAGAEVAVDLMRSRVPVRTGRLRDSLAIEGPSHTTADGYYCDIVPRGTHPNGRKGERMETVGFVQEYGRSNMPAQPFMRPTIEADAGAISDAMADVLTKGAGL